MMINILGRSWNFTYKTDEEKDINLDGSDGYCDWTTRDIVVRKVPRDDGAHVNDLDRYERKCARHEIVHAFLFECGLGHNSKGTDSWATNEEMVDWFAFQGPKIMQAWKDAGVEN